MQTLLRLMVWFWALSTAAVSLAAPVELQTQLATSDIAPHIEYFIDARSTYDINSIAQQNFAPNRDESLNLGAVEGHVWMRLRIENKNPAQTSWVLSFNRALLADLEVYSRLPGGEYQEMFNLHREDAEKNSLQRYGTLATRITLPVNEPQQIVIRFKGYNSYALPLTVESELELTRKRSREVSFFLVIAAGVLTFVLYNALVHGFSGDRPFLYYGLAQVAMLAYFGHIEGITTAYLWPQHASLGASLAPIFGTIISISILAFARSFIAGQPNTVVWNWALNTTLALSAIAFGLAFSGATTSFPPNGVVLAGAYITSFITWLLLPALAVTATLRWQNWHWPLVPAWLAMSGFTFYTAAVFAGIAPISDWHPYLYGIAAYCEAGFLSLALALRLRHQRQQHLHTEQKLNLSLQRELHAARRTAQLAESRAVVIGELAQRESLLRTASHDSRQLIATLKQTAYALDHGAANTEVKDVLENAADYLDTVLSTTSDAALTGGFDDSVIAIDSVTEADLLEPLRMLFEQAAAEKGIGLEIHAGRHEVAVDRALLLRILANLVSNAIKYTATGKVTVSASSEDQALQIRVQDTGSGLSSAQIDALLAHNTPSVRFSEDANGSGTGWKVIRDLAGRLHAELSIESSTQQGSTVMVTLPQGQLDSTAASLAAGPPIELDLDASSLAETLVQAREFARQDQAVVITTFDHSLSLRREVGSAVSYILYKPITPLARSTLQHLIS